MIKFEGKCGVSATVICDSISEAGIRLLTFEITYWRGILSELNTHRMLSKNSASSRAIPFKKMQENLTGRPSRFGQANPGMQDKGEEFNTVVYGRSNGYESHKFTAKEAWAEARKDAVFWSNAFYEAGYHKQVYNRICEPHQMMKTVLSGTEMENLFWLRNDDAADPSIAALTHCMKQAMDASTPKLLLAGEYHLPYVEYELLPQGGLSYYITNDEGVDEFLSTEDAIKVSCARAASVSFRNSDYGLEKSKQVYERLIGDERKHASALEHQASPMQARSVKDHVNMACYAESWEDGVSHADRNGQLWSGNFRGFVQYRKLIPGENKVGY